MHDSDELFEDCVLLLDEPGLHLHPSAQSDLLQRLDEYSKCNTIIYTTHLPFLVDLREPGRIRVAEDVDGEARISDTLIKKKSDERLALQAALGMKLSQHYLVSQKNLVVEGIDDFWILSEMSRLLAKSGRNGLSDEIEIVTGNGADGVVYMTMFLAGQDLEVVALFDSDNKGRQSSKILEEKWLKNYKSSKICSLSIGGILETERKMTIEDLFSEDYYMKIIRQISNETKYEFMKPFANLSLEKNEECLLANIRIAAEKAGIDYKKFDKMPVAHRIRRHLSKASTIDDIKNLGPNLVDYAERLFRVIESSLGVEQTFESCKESSNVHLQIVEKAT